MLSDSGELKFVRRLSFKGLTIYDYPVYWYLDNFNSWNCLVPIDHPHFGGLSIVHTFIMSRPHYCDRGKYIVLCDHIDLDIQDGLPKYGMHLYSLMYEMTCWLKWRIEKRYYSLDLVFNPPTVKLEDLKDVDYGCEQDPQTVVETLKEIYRQHTTST